MNATHFLTSNPPAFSTIKLNVQVLLLAYQGPNKAFVEITSGGVKLSTCEYLRQVKISHVPKLDLGEFLPLFLT